jgi:hypothetical protein
MMPAIKPSMRPAERPGFKPGMILAFTLVILVLMSLMGMTILLNTRTELSISSNTSLGRNAFATADTAAQIATLIGRIMLHPELGGPEQVLIAPDKQDGQFRLDVLFNCDPTCKDLIDPCKDPTGNPCSDNSKILSDLLFKEFDEDPGFDLSVQRYRRAAGSEAPHLFFKSKIGDRTVTVATAALALDSETASSKGGDYPITPGASLGGGDAYDNASGTRLSVVLVVSVNGRALNMRTDGNWEFDESSDARSIITILYREQI